MHRIGIQWFEIESFVEYPSVVVFGMDKDRANSCDLRCLDGSTHGVFQQARSNTTTLPVLACSKSREQHDRNGVPRETFLQAYCSSVMFYISRRKRVVPHYFAIGKCHICLSTICRLVLERKTDQELIELFLTTIELTDLMLAGKFLNP